MNKMKIMKNNCTTYYIIQLCLNTVTPMKKMKMLKWSTI